MMNMKKVIIIIAIVVCILTAFCLFFSYTKADVSSFGRKYQHEEESDVDPGIGMVEIPADGMVEEGFQTHLPLIVIDVDLEKIPNIYGFVDDKHEVRGYRDENVTNPWETMTISLIDNENNVNTLGDLPVFESGGMIKIRGASSRAFEKKQYGIKLLDESGMESEQSLLGMEADEDWVLSNSILDATHIRNYMAYNIAGQIFPYTPEARFCEVIVHHNDTYQYQGLYLLTETVKKAKGRVDIADFDPKEPRLSYILCRDRKDDTATTLSTWASDNRLCYGWFTFKYPKEELLTEEVVNRIEEDVSAIERVLYSDDWEEFLTYPQYIDVDSFVDYFVVNEFFMNYDSGNNSTYYYQDYSHKFSMGPLWDYDNCWDNYSLSAGDADYLVMQLRPWFERLVRDPRFVELVCRRYAELRETIFSTEYVYAFIDDTVAYLGNAVWRERSRWRGTYEENHMLHIVEEGKGYVIDRNRDTYEEEIIRMKDMIVCHGEWMDKYLYDFLGGYLNEDIPKDNVELLSAIAATFILAFVIMIVLINRKVKGI